MKARKNHVEIEGMKHAHVKDAVAVCEFLSFMENEVRIIYESWTWQQSKIIVTVNHLNKLSLTAK